jgi:hypothetical protein
VTTPNNEADETRRKKREFALTTWVAGAGALASGIAALAAVGALVVGVVTSWDKLFGPPEPLISMKNSDFIKLPYGQQLDLCVPYIRENVDRAYRDWKAALKDWPESTNDEITRADDEHPGGQALVNFHMTVREMARTNGNYDMAKNLISCAYSTAENKIGFDPYAEIGGGNAKPYPVYTALSESESYKQGTFAGFSADGRPSKIVKERSTAVNLTVEVGYTLVSGAGNSGNQIWVATAEVLPNNPAWIPDLTNLAFTGDPGHA